MIGIRWTALLVLCLAGAGCAGIKAQSAASPARPPAAAPSPEREFPKVDLGLAKAELRKGEKVRDKEILFWLNYLGASEQDRELLGLLKKQGGDIDVLGGQPPQTPLQLAVIDGNTTAARVLLGQGANPKVRSRGFGATLLYDAVNTDNAEMAELLLARGANVNEGESTFGAAPLHSAAMEGKLPMARVLIAHGAALNVKSKQGVTPLHLAANAGRVAMVELLLRAGADPELTSDQGTTPAQAALQAGHPEVVALLKKYEGVEWKTRRAIKRLMKGER